MHRVFPTGKPSIAFRQALDLKQRLTRSTLKMPFHNDTGMYLSGCYKCEHPKKEETMRHALSLMNLTHSKVQLLNVDIKCGIN